MENFITSANELMWSLTMVVGLLALGLYFTIRMAVPQVRLVKDMVGQLVHGGSSSAGVSSFQAFAMALGGRIGVGNIAGVAAAIHLGGPGALFWMWVTAIVGAPVALAESSLAQLYKHKIRGEYRGGPAYYILEGLGRQWRWLAFAYAAATVFATVVTGPQIQANAVTAATTAAWGWDPLWVGVAMAALFCAIVFGGMHRLGRTVGLVVPFMAAAYILVGLFVVAMMWQQIPAMFAMIVESAFGAHSIYGGILGAAVSWGVRRAVYSTEIGTGSGAQASAAAHVSHPVKQGLAQAFSAYVDTLFVCTVTGLVILATNSFDVLGPDGESTLTQNLPGVDAGPAWVQAGVDTVLPAFGPAFVAVAVFLFSFTTLLSFSFYAETNLAYLIPDKGVQKACIAVARVLLAASMVFGSVQTSAFVWSLADFGVGLYTWVNILALVLLSPMAIRLMKDYDRQRRAGQDPILDPDTIGARNAHLWRQVHAEYQRTGDVQAAMDHVADTAPDTRSIAIVPPRGR
ncbi:alanine/glycine:cation symporter family protein [Micrococcus sp. 2A]|uniref:alanine/glycine:cation symporter family protein n=1 Tax=Micrococcus TaxID=1269 RepID=UPI0020030C55|nr:MULTISPECIES: alanine/glycine:cation symporter family protein [unclassified Micrococcus]MCK6095107.1 alanine:cation symporter family protein [Micrococcus sp. EYE_212]MCK6171054.1 alanine:cation symporter family protein [Micrococcus sp. EYE_162]MDX2342029.1 alanine:cation symporter family protein [Micrococcus sp. M4NT]